MRSRLESRSTSQMTTGRSQRSGHTTTSLREDAHRRLHDIRPEIEGAIHVLDNGVNRTPQPLQTKSQGHRRGGGGGGQDNADIGASIFQSSFLMSSAGESSSKLHGSISYLQSSARRNSTSLMESSMRSLSMTDHRQSDNSTSCAERESRNASAGVAGSVLFGDRKTLLSEATADKRVPLGEVEKRAWVKAKTTVLLTETPTIFLFSHQDEFVSNENREEVKLVKERNEYYEQLQESHRLDEGTQFQRQGAVTFTAPKKSIHSEVHPPETVDSGALQVTTWMLRDEFAPLLDDADDEGEEPTKVEDEDAELEEDMNDEVNENSTSEAASNRQGGTAGEAKSGQPWMFADSLMPNLRIMERAVVQNYMEKVQLLYRGIVMDPSCSRIKEDAPVETPPPAVEASHASRDGVAALWGASAVEGSIAEESVASSKRPDTAEKKDTDLPNMHMTDDIKALWRFHSPLTEGRGVTCMTWNRKEPDILAVGYGARRTPAEEDDAEKGKKTKSIGSEQSGMVCCWSLKNPLAPELTLHLNADAGVSAIAFSYEHPSLLAVGNTDGGIVVYDIQKDLAAPSISPAVTAGLHTGAVWDLKWVAQGKERGEFLMSISADGRVVQWAVGKSIEKVAPDLMHLKRQPGSQVESAFVEGVTAADEAVGKRRSGAKEEAVLSRQSGGMSFDICPADSAIYVVGTEDGSIFQCNKSQTESYDLDYSPHAELVYRVRWSPYSANYFLTCSADWTTRLYRLGTAHHVIRFDSPNQDAVQDVAWSYTNSLAFATATAQGNVELWSVMDTIYPRSTIQFEDHRRLSCVLFAEQETPVIVVGDEEGDVTVFLLSDSLFKRQDLTDDEQEHWLQEAIKKQTT